MQQSRRICILDYGAGNVRSVAALVGRLTDKVDISNNKQTIKDATHLILPGVGSFPASMLKIKTMLPLDMVSEEVIQGKPFLGICIGMQVLAETGLEGGGSHSGLGWVDGQVELLN